MMTRSTCWTLMIAVHLLMGVTGPLYAQSAILEVRAQVSPSLEEFRVLEDAPGDIVSVTVANSPTPYPCRLVLRGNVLCRVRKFPSTAPDLQLSIDVPGHQLARKTAQVRTEGNRRVVVLDQISLIPADVTASRIVLSYSPSAKRLELSVTNRQTEPITISRITLDAMRPTGTCAVEEPIPVFQLSTTLYVQEQSVGRWAVATTTRNPDNPAERLNITGEYIEDGCFDDRLVVELPARIFVPRQAQVAVDIILPAKFDVESRTLRGNAAHDPSARNRLTTFDGSTGKFSLYVVTFHTSSPTSPRVRSFVSP